MRRRTCAALLCGPLVVGCGTATRVDFRPHSRPAAPVEVSVYVGTTGIHLDPSRLSAGPVQFEVTNQSHTAVRVGVFADGARTLARSPRIPVGGTAELQTTLGRGGADVELTNRPTAVALLRIAGRGRRNGDNSLLRP